MERGLYTLDGSALKGLVGRGLVPSCFVIYDLELLSLSFDVVFSSEIFKSLSFRLDRLCHLAILCLDQHAHTLHHLESLLTISLDRLDIFEGRSCISEFVRNSGNFGGTSGGCVITDWLWRVGFAAMGAAGGWRHVKLAHHGWRINRLGRVVLVERQWWLSEFRVGVLGGEVGWVWFVELGVGVGAGLVVKEGRRWGRGNVSVGGRGSWARGRYLGGWRGMRWVVGKAVGGGVGGGLKGGGVLRDGKEVGVGLFARGRELEWMVCGVAGSLRGVALEEMGGIGGVVVRLEGSGGFVVVGRGVGGGLARFVVEGQGHGVGVVLMVGCGCLVIGWRGLVIGEGEGSIWSDSSGEVKDGGSGGRKGGGGERRVVGTVRGVFGI
ncbi:hypothetical protein Tco_0731883 [Tanacetum coccineum]